MGSSCSTHDEYQEEQENKPDKIDLIKINEEKYTNQIFSFCKSFEKNFNLLATMQLENYLLTLNNFNCKKKPENPIAKPNSNKGQKYTDDLAKINFIEINHIRKSNNSLNLNSNRNDFENNNNFNNKRNTKFQSFNSLNNLTNNNYNKTSSFFRNSLDEEKFINFIYNKIINNPLREKENLISENKKLLFCYERFLKNSFWNMQRFLFNFNKSNKNQKNFLEVPLIIISSIGFNFCESKRSKKINLLANMLCNSEGIITQENPNVEAFFYLYLQNAIVLPVYFLLLETQNYNFLSKDELKILLGNENEENNNDEKLKKSFFIKNVKTDYPCIIFSKDSKSNVINPGNGSVKKEEIEINSMFDLFFKDVLKLVFGSAGKKMLNKVQFMRFLSDEEEGGGFWLLFNEAIRKKFEVFIENQNS